jgi:hypothetical protein
MQLATDNNMGFYETSAKYSTNINEAFECLYKEMSKKSQGKKSESTFVVKENNKCCQ